MSDTPQATFARPDYVNEIFSRAGTNEPTDPFSPEDWIHMQTLPAEVIAELPESDRILIHAGFSHAAEVPIRGPDGNPLEWMAARLKRRTGIDPLTIDQTDCRSGSDEIQLTNASPGHAEGQHDLMVAHPDLRFVDGRPEWRTEGPVTRVAIPNGIVSQSSRTIVEARFLDEPIDAVPIDRVMLWPGESLPLLLPAGSYLIVGFHEGSDAHPSTRIDISPEPQ